MLDYTIVATQKTVDDIKKFSFITALFTQALYIDYLIYAIIMGVGFIWLNIPLLVISSAYFIFFLAANGKSGKKIKSAKKSAAHGYKILKITAASFNLAVLLYSIWAFPDEVKPISIVLATLMTLVLVLNVFFEMLSVFAERRLNLFITALKADLELITKPVTGAQNFIRKIRGEEPIEDNSEPTGMRKMLDQRVEARRAERLVQRRDKREKFANFIFGKARLKSKSEADEYEFSEK